MSELSVLVGIPSTGMWHARFGISLFQLIADFSRAYDGYDEQRLNICHKVDSILPRSRTQIAQKAVSDGCTHLLFVDSDQVFPHYTLRKLLSWQKSVVACNVAVKRFPSGPTARAKNGTRSGKPLFTREGQSGLEQVWRIGTGVMLIEVDVFHRIEQPWFPMKWLKEINDWQGEDWGFCERLDMFGIPIYVDHELSWDIAHVGTMEYTHDLVFDPQEPGEKWAKMVPSLTGI